ncbi:MAG: TraR/DksA C4-type zinc finger protein [Acidimicrobiaceae bacterium]|nr:TraR/DksA C4-type zinc finger protein [Acidimicrobiaceae bacterium]
MSSADLREARALIADLESELFGIAEATAAGPDDEHDAEGSTVGYERARVGALLAAARRRLAELESVPPTPAGGSRRCVACGQPIPAERLDVLPATSRCVRCAADASRPITLANRHEFAPLLRGRRTGRSPATGPR